MQDLNPVFASLISSVVWYHTDGQLGGRSVGACEEIEVFAQRSWLIGIPSSSPRPGKITNAGVTPLHLGTNIRGARARNTATPGLL